MGKELYLSKAYYQLCMAILKQAQIDKDSEKYGLEVKLFYDNSYVFDLCKDYIELYRDREVELSNFKKEILC